MIDSPTLSQLAELVYNTFCANASPFSFNRFSPGAVKESTGKLEGSYITIADKLTVEDVADHLAGKTAYGIVPITADGMSDNVVIDVDGKVYKDAAAAAQVHDKVTACGLPLLITESKSGGMHIRLWINELVPVPKLRLIGQHIADNILSISKAEIFPKQDKVDQQLLGNAIGLPFFGIKEDGFSQRDGFYLGQRVCVAEALELIQTAKDQLDTQGGWEPLYADAVASQKVIKKPLGDAFVLEKVTPPQKVIPIVVEGNPIAADGPPCLAHLWTANVPAGEGVRNNAAFNIAVYAKKAGGDDWEDLFYELVEEMLEEPLAAKEYRAILKSVGDKDYFYRCSEEPIASCCDKATCRTKAHGIGTSGVTGAGGREIVGFKCLAGDPDKYFITCYDPLDGSTHDRSFDVKLFVSPRDWQRWCLDNLRTPAPILKKEALDLLKEDMFSRLQTTREEDQPSGSSYKTSLLAEMDDFLTNRSSAKELSQVRHGRPYIDHDKGVAYFILRHFEAILKAKGVETRGVQAMHMLLESSDHQGHLEKVQDAQGEFEVYCVTIC